MQLNPFKTPEQRRKITIVILFAFSAALTGNAGRSDAQDSGTHHASTGQPRLDWWNDSVTDPVLAKEQWVSFDLDTVLLDTLQHSPKIQSVSHRTSIAMEKVVQQDAAFDPTVLLDTMVGRTNDPVGNTLTTGGPPRLVEQSLTATAGIRRTTRTGTVIDLSQELGLLDSNSQFFDPANQGSARLSLSLVKPLKAGSGRVYNERLLTQARIAGNISWQEMRGEVERRIFEVVNSYWQLYQLRCQLMQQDRLIGRGRKIQDVLEGRSEFDSSRIEIAKARQRTARRNDRRLAIDAELAIEQSRLAALIGSDELEGAANILEFIPLDSPEFPDLTVGLRDAVLQGIENRPEVRAAAADLESAALSIRVTRNELLPSISAVVDTYLAGINGRSRFGQSFIDQFRESGPGVSAGLQYEMPYGRRAALSRHREAHHRYQQLSEELRETIRQTRLQIETALIIFQRTVAQQETKRQLLTTAIEEEDILTRRWEMMAGDGGNVGTVLETLLDAQQRRTDAEREWVTAQTEYLITFVDLQRTMGTLLTYQGVTPVRTGARNSSGTAPNIVFTRDESPAPVDAASMAEGPLAVDANRAADVISRTDKNSRDDTASPAEIQQQETQLLETAVMRENEELVGQWLETGLLPIENPTELEQVNQP